MEQGFTLTFGAFIAGLVVIGWWLIQRELTKNDKEDTKWKDSIELKVKSLESEHMEVLLQLERKTSREELDKVYDAIKEVSLKVDNNSMKTIELLTTLVGHGNREGFERPR